IDQPSERRLATQREINAAAEIGGRDDLPRHTLDRARHGRRIKPSSVDEIPAADRRRLVAAYRELKPVTAHMAAQYRRAERNKGARLFRLALITEHQRMAVD